MVRWRNWLPAAVGILRCLIIYTFLRSILIDVAHRRQGDTPGAVVVLDLISLLFTAALEDGERRNWVIVVLAVVLAEAARILIVYPLPWWR